MKNYDYWKSFINTGKIDDYLHYIACAKEDDSDEIAQTGEYAMYNRYGSVQDLKVSSRSMNTSALGTDISRKSMERDKEGGFIAGIN